MIEVSTNPNIGHVSAADIKAVMISAAELARGLDPSGLVERYLISQEPEDMYRIALCLVKNHEHAVNLAMQDYAKKYVPAVGASEELIEEVLDGLVETLKFSWIVDGDPRCYGSSPYNPNWEALYYFRVTLMPIEDAVEQEDLPYTTDDIQVYKECYGGAALCIFFGSLVDQPKVH